jgi:osmotically-inducible protein OsmY
MNHPASTKEIQLSKLKPHYAWPFALILAGALSGCATNGKCESGGCTGDTKITTNVQALLDRHPELGPPNSITVQTRARVVYLYGEASTSLERDTAESLAAGTPGVARVVNSVFISR